MCYLICDVITCYVWSYGKGKINVYDKIMILNQKKKRKYKNQRNYYINHHLKDRLQMEFTAC